MSMGKLELECKILAGAESKAWLIEFKQAIDRLEKLAGKFEMSKSQAETSPTTTVEVDSESEDDEEDFTTPAKKKPGRPPGSKNKSKASFDDEDDEDTDEETDSEETEEDSDEIDVSELKNGKAKKITLDMLNDAAKELSKSKGKQGRAHVLGLLKKHFKTESISDIDEKDYAKALKVLEIKK